MLEMPDGSKVDLKELVAEEAVKKLQDAGFQMENGKIQNLPVEIKTEAQQKLERVEKAADFIKSLIVPPARHKQYGIKQITTDVGSFGAAVPTELATEIVQKRDKFSVFGPRAFTLESAGPFDVPVEGEDVTAYWVGEGDSGDANLIDESHPTLEKVSLGDHYLAALVKTSFKLVNTSAFNIVNYISSLAGRKLAGVQETAFIAGDGTGKPKGLRTYSGISGVAQQGASLSYGDLLNLWFSLPAQYRANAVFITSPKGAKAIHNLRDGENRPLFQAGMPLDEIFRRPILESVDVPENLAGDSTEIFFGDPSYYWIKYGTGMEMATQPEIERLQTKLVTYQAVDGRLTLTDAWKKLTGVTSADES